MRRGLGSMLQCALPGEQVPDGVELLGAQHEQPGKWEWGGGVREQIRVYF